MQKKEKTVYSVTCFFIIIYYFKVGSQHAVQNWIKVNALAIASEVASITDRC